jgi:hypothetical protein
MQGFLGGVSSPAFESAHVPPQLPLPLSWEGRTDYSHSFYSPQSEVGLWAAFTIGHAFSPTHQRATVVLHTATYWSSSCGGDLASTPRFEQSVEAFAIQRIDEAIAHYASAGIMYEQTLSQSVRAQVRSASAFANGNHTGALAWSAKARDLELAALAYFLPTSTSLFFVPGTAFDGSMSLVVANTTADHAVRRALLLRAKGSFAHCLSPHGRPNLPICHIGAARTALALGDSGLAQAHYRGLVSTWANSSTAAAACSPALAEAAAHLSVGPPPPPGLGSGHSGPSTLNLSLGVGFGAGFFGLLVGILIGMRASVYRERRGRGSESIELQLQGNVSESTVI